MTNDKIIEDYFKALGYSKYKEMPFGMTWVNKSLPYQEQKDTMLTSPLPNIINHFPSFKKWVIEEMKKYEYNMESKRGYITWEPIGFFTKPGMHVLEEPIKDNEITKAAVIAATKYLLSK